jgi:hypothetical protein
MLLACLVLVGSLLAQSSMVPKTENWFFKTGVFGPMPATQTVAAADTITADACGGYKRVTAAGAVTTNTTNTFTAPRVDRAPCAMLVCNVGGTNAITLDNNALFVSIGAADIVLGANDCTQVVSDGTLWRSTGSLVAN